jgi:hypothetical protein
MSPPPLYFKKKIDLPYCITSLLFLTGSLTPFKYYRFALVWIAQFIYFNYKEGYCQGEKKLQRNTSGGGDPLHISIQQMFTISRTILEKKTRVYPSLKNYKWLTLH